MSVKIVTKDDKAFTKADLCMLLFVSKSMIPCIGTAISSKSSFVRTQLPSLLEILDVTRSSSASHSITDFYAVPPTTFHDFLKSSVSITR